MTRGLGPWCTGVRVVVRRILEGETGPTGGPAMTDLLGVLEEWGEPTITVERIQEVVSAHFKVPLHLLISTKRSKEVAMARQVAMYLSRELTKNSLPDIGRQFGGKDHTTVLHGYKQIKRLVESDGQLRAEIEQLVTRLQN